MSDLTRARANIRRATAEQGDPRRVRLNRADLELVMADYLRLTAEEAASERQTDLDVMIDAGMILAIVPLCVAAGWLLRA